MSEIKIINKRCDWVRSDDPEDVDNICGLIGEMEVEEDGERKFLTLDYQIESNDVLECGLNFLVTDNSTWPEVPEVPFDKAAFRHFYDQFQILLYDIGDLIIEKYNIAENEAVGSVLSVSEGTYNEDMTIKQFFDLSMWGIEHE